MRKILTDRQLFSLELLCLRCGQNFIIDQLIGLIKGFDHLGRFRMEIDFIQRFGFGRMLQNNIQMRQSREAALYGDDIVRYGSVPITAKGQMVQNRRAKTGK